MRRCIWVSCVSLCALGCGGRPYGASLERALNAPQAAAPARSSEPGGTGGTAETTGKGAATLPRKIIYTAQVTLVVEDFDETESRIDELVKRFGGYLSESNVNRTQGAQRSGKWVARIPVDQFDEFLSAVVEIGVPENRQTNAQDVTEEYVDLEARIKNKQEIERRVVKLLEDRSGEIKDVIAVENELGRVREEIERMQGRLRYLANVTALTTVTISAREQRNYVPPQAPTLNAQIGQTWTKSVDGLRDLSRMLVLFAVALAPWLPVIAVPLALLVWVIRRLVRRPVPLPAARS